ncbi:MAG: pseudouridine synthase [Oceanospirillaceae bacterium]|nr:pseudouridine synthase [Oceanospirillaceae bacterium]
MRLDKYICKSTELTKAEAVERINAGEVLVNGLMSGVENDGDIINASTQVHENNCIFLEGQRLKTRAFRYLLLHKPAGVICSSTDEKGYPSLFNDLAIDRVQELHIAGRLDVDTTGLVLITDDGRWTYNITVPTKQCKKVYRVLLSTSITDEAKDKLVARFKMGIELQGELQLTLPAHLEIVTDKEVLLTIIEGKYHQVKRMFAAIGNRVVALHREKIGDVALDVEVGEWRYLTQTEVASFIK